ncbi:SGNH/GDSL hydrolase family protein [Polaribacter glomeratus]|uniref:G-D-S-L family lipolytic protein n=1 Tax=Polaribacter glomeratus TaxID=102 RepID=A0A2S7WGK4_9FLAO|nr:G-D-S-L family lipolytic protein [Polaribacter glomeratus]PQJ76744.1 G-D-S-L family lipolytic protein [Polaribacter glomeratus]TXD67414.1 G-D-S-L family lipolytic protein [Polaribacter glomeratus]
MKNYKYIGLFLLSLSIASCDVNNELEPILEEAMPQVQLNTNGLDFTRYISIGTSLTAGFTDGALFKAGQENSFPNILAEKFGVTGFKQPLMNDNIGGFVFNGTAVLAPRFYFNGAAPTPLPALPTTQFGARVAGPFNNYGLPGAKSFHLGIAGYGALNPYFGRMASSASATVMGDALAQDPTFFTLDIGANDVLFYATNGGAGADQTGNFNPATYGPNDITDPNVFASLFSGMVTALTAKGAKGVVTNVPNVTDAANFKTIPFNAIPLNAATAAQLNGAFAAYNGGLQQLLAAKNAGLLPAQVLPLLANFNQAEVDKRKVTFVAGQNAVLILDENLSNLAPINPGLTKMRQATSADLLLLASRPVLGTTVGGNPQLINGVSVPLEDKWVLTPQEQALIKTATDAYNATIAAVVASNPNIALGDINGLLTDVTKGVMFDNYMLTANLVTGGFFSLDGVHPTGRGYALAANRILAAMDVKFGTNFTTATNGLAKADDHPTNYTPSLR